MTQTFNIHNAPAWAALTTYAVGARVSHDTAPVKAYQVISITTGISGATGPTGTGSSIVDGGVTWKYLSSVDYTSQAAASAGLGTLTQPTVVQTWNDVPGTPYTTVGVTLSGHSTTATNTLTWTVAPGDSFADNVNAQVTSLAYNASNGVAVTTSADAAFAPINIGEDYVTLSRFQLEHVVTATSYYAYGLYVGPSSHNVINTSIIHSTGSGVTAAIVNFYTTGGTITNSLIYSNKPGEQGVEAHNGISIVNVDIANISGSTTAGTGVISGTPANTTIINTAVFGFPTFANGGASVSSNNASDKTISFGTNNQASKVFANQFVSILSASPDFRIKSGADCIDHGATETGYIPSATDIVGTSRPQGSAWDIGCWEWISPTTPTNINPGAGSILLSGAAPTVTAGATILPAAGIITATGYVPGITFETVITLGVGSVTLTGHAPSVAMGTTISLGSGTISFLGFPPAVAMGTTINPANGSVSIAGYAATVTFGNTILTGVGLINLTGAAPSIAIGTTIYTGAGAISVTGLAPSVALGLTIHTGSGSMEFFGHIPTVTYRQTPIVRLAAIPVDVRIAAIPADTRMERVPPDVRFPLVPIG